MKTGKLEIARFHLQCQSSRCSKGMVVSESNLLVFKSCQNPDFCDAVRLAVEEGLTCNKENCAADVFCPQFLGLS